jgi:myotubularin-related protein 1/2
MKQISRTTATKIAEDELDPLSAFVHQPPPPPTNGNKPLPSSGSPNSNVGGFHIRDDADQRDKSEFVTVEKLKIVSSVKRDTITPSTSSSALSHEGSPAKLRQGSVSPIRGNQGDEPRPSSLRLSNSYTVNHPTLLSTKRSSGDSSPAPVSQDLSPTVDSTSATDDFPFMSGEMKVMSMTHAAVHVIPMGGISGVLYMTNYRIVFLPSEADVKSLRRTSVSFLSWLNVPLACIDRIEREKRPKETPNAGITMMIYCKDCRQLRINIKPQSSSNGDYDLERAFSLMNTYAFPNNLRYLFAYNHSIGRFDIGTLHNEYERMGLFKSPLWRISHVNQDFRLCSTYPEELVVPCNITDDELHVIGAFRSGHRLPVLCWATGRHSASVWRSSQPKAGVSGSCTQDIRMLDVIARSTSAQRQKDNAARQSAVAVSTDSVLYIVDARSRNSAMANMAAGAGYETQNYYSSCRLDFYNIPNIHAVRDSYKGMLNLVLNPTANPASDISFSKQIEDTNWLTNVRLILKASFETAAFVNKGYPVLVHCSHGWDRTAQITALAQLFLDPYYRTFEGFPVLIEKEWLAFGHQFQMRCAHGQDRSQRQEQEFSPIFIQFLDCLWQILHRFGQHFEFNTKYVLAVADHVYSGRFGTFLFSSESDRRSYQARTHSADLWQYLASNRTLLTNRFFVPVGGVFLPPLGQLLRGVTLWSDYFLRWSSVVSIPNLGAELANYTSQLRQ